MRDLARSAGESAARAIAETAERQQRAVAREAEKDFQQMLLHDLLPATSPIFDSSWRIPAVVALAEAIYEDRAFDRLPTLADALEDAGCVNSDILKHCRGPGPHVRGCWVVDLILGKS